MIAVDKKVLKGSKLISKNKGISLSRAIENFLRFFSDSWVCCFKYGEKFGANKGNVCPKCGLSICPQCEAYRCSLDEKVVVQIFLHERVL